MGMEYNMENIAIDSVTSSYVDSNCIRGSEDLRIWVEPIFFSVVQQ